MIIISVFIINHPKVHIKLKGLATIQAPWYILSEHWYDFYLFITKSYHMASEELKRTSHVNYCYCASY